MLLLQRGLSWTILNSWAGPLECVKKDGRGTVFFKQDACTAIDHNYYVLQQVSSRKVTLQVCLSGQQEFLWKLSSTLEMCSVQHQVETSRFMEVIMVTTEVKINFFDSLLHVGCLNNLK